ncbi:MAG: hypothetical protein Q7U39_07800 [Nitrospira sp.]|nr:hypothetical protein [Nitrospira sp.]
MKIADATAEVFMTAFESLPKSEREAIMQRLFANPALKEDLIDVAKWYDRRAERAIPYQRVRQRLKKAGCL